METNRQDTHVPSLCRRIDGGRGRESDCSRPTKHDTFPLWGNCCLRHCVITQVPSPCHLIVESLVCDLDKVLHVRIK